MSELLSTYPISVWILVGALIVTIIYFLEDSLSFDSNNYREDNGGGLGSTISIIVFVGICYFTGLKSDILNILEFAQKHFFDTILLYVVIYIVAGIVWSFVKWYFFLIGLRDYYDNNNITLTESSIPKAKNNKFRIISWMSYWPFSLIWTFINEPVKRGYNYLHNRLGKWYDKMSDKIFADLTVKAKKEND